MIISIREGRDIFGLSGVGGLGVTANQVTTTVGSSIMGAAGIVAMANPIAGAIVGAVGMLTTLVGGFFKPDLKKVEATHIVDQIESQVLQPLVREWQALPPGMKTVEMQAQAEGVFDQAWGAVLQGCGNPQLESAGYNCIHDRERGSTKGYDWFKLYRDPIANDTVVATPPAGLTVNTDEILKGDFSSITDAVQGLDYKKLLIPVGVIAGVMLLSREF